MRRRDPRFDSLRGVRGGPAHTGLALASLALLLSGVGLVSARSAAAQQDEEGIRKDVVHAPGEEQPDPTRLDAETLPPEAAEITRDLYAHGFFVESGLGARGYIGGAGRLSAPGFHMSAGFGYEILRWLWVKLTVEGSIHRTDAPAPPTPTVFEVVGTLAEVRFQLDVTPRFAMWLGVEGGLLHVTSDVLVTYGLEQSDELGFLYGGQIGVDWHMQNRHNSLGLLAGARLYPPLDGPDGERAVGVHGQAYLRYVF